MRRYIFKDFSTVSGECNSFTFKPCKYSVLNEGLSLWPHSLCVQRGRHLQEGEVGGAGVGGCLGLTGIRVFVKVDRLATSSWRKKD